MPRASASRVVRRARGAAWALLAAAMFGLVGVVSKGIDASGLAIACGAYVVAAVALLPSLRGLRLAPRDGWRLAGVTLFGGVLAPVALFQGLRMTTAVDASLLLTLEMAFTAGLASVYLHERVRTRALLGLALLLASAALVALPARDAGGERSLWGNALVAAAALAWSIDNVVSTGLATRHDPRRLIAAKSLGGGLALLALLLATTGVPALSGRDAAALALIGLVGVAGSTIVFYHALRVQGATRTVGLFVPASALVGAAGGALLLGEPLGWMHALAALLAVAGATLVTETQ